VLGLCSIELACRVVCGDSDCGGDFAVTVRHRSKAKQKRSPSGALFARYSSYPLNPTNTNWSPTTARIASTSPALGLPLGIILITMVRLTIQLLYSIVTEEGAGSGKEEKTPAMV